MRNESQSPKDRLAGSSINGHFPIGFLTTKGWEQDVLVSRSHPSVLKLWRNLDQLFLTSIV